MATVSGNPIGGAKITSLPRGVAIGSAVPWRMSASTGGALGHGDVRLEPPEEAIARNRQGSSQLSPTDIAEPEENPAAKIRVGSTQTVRAVC